MSLTLRLGGNAHVLGEVANQESLILGINVFATNHKGSLHHIRLNQREIKLAAQLRYGGAKWRYQLVRLSAQT